MGTTNEALFQLMRFNILNSGRADMISSPFSRAYIYAWESGVFPALNKTADWHKAFPEQFYVSENEVSDLLKLLDDKRLEEIPITFYQLEDHYDVTGINHSSSTWNRMKLVATCRYLYLNGALDNSFWSSLTENGECPNEAHSICRPMSETDVYFM
jgi:hypothetical protein